MIRPLPCLLAAVAVLLPVPTQTIAKRQTAQSTSPQQVEVCAISGKRANPHCPDTLTMAPQAQKTDATCTLHAAAEQGPFPRAIRLTQGPGEAFEPAFLADGRIVYVSNQDGNDEIYVMSADGSNSKRLTQNSQSDRFPTQGPKGTILFQSKRHDQWDIYCINLDGSEEKQLTVEPSDDTHPTLAPGNRIVFASARHATPQIFSMSVDGSNVRRLTNSDYPVGSPSCSGDRIVFTTQFPAESDKVNTDIFVMFADGFAPQRLTKHSGDDLYPAISASGTIVFTSNRDGNAEIYSMKADGSQVRRLTKDKATDESPAISKGGSIVFVSNRGGNRALYRLE